jgi:autotransporter-associated beta strand protein
MMDDRSSNKKPSKPKPKPSMTKPDSSAAAKAVSPTCLPACISPPRQGKEKTRDAIWTRSFRLSISLGVLLSQVSHADLVWQGDTDSDFNTGSNYLGDSYAQWSDYIFDANAINGTVNVDDYTGWGNISLNSGLGTDIVIQSANPASHPVIMAPGLYAGGAISLSSDSKDLTVNTNYLAVNGQVWNVGAGRTLTVNGSFQNWNGATSSLEKRGSGTAILTSGNNYNGGTTIAGGTLRANRGSLGTGAVVVQNGGTLYLNDQWVLCGANPYGVATGNIGTLTLQAGATLRLDAIQGFANGATNLILNGALVTGGPNDFRGDLFLWNGNQQITTGGAASSTIASIIGVTGNNNTITVEDGSTLNVTGGIKNSDWYGNGSSPGGFIKAGSGTLNLTSGSYTGATEIAGGTLTLQDAAFSNAPRAYTIASGAVLQLTGNMGFASGTTTLGGNGTLRITGGTLANGAGPGRNINIDLANNAVIDIQAGAAITNGGWQTMTWTGNRADLNVDGTFDIWDGQAVFADALTGSGQITKNHGGNSPTMLTVGVANGGGTFSGEISNTAGQTAFTKQGSGTQILTGNNTYSGATMISDGTLQIGDGGTSGTLGSGPVTIASGATLAINRRDDFSFSAGQYISGAGSLIKNGTGTLTLPNSQTFTGGITLNQGGLKAGSNQAFGASGTTFALNDGSIHLNGYSQNLAAVTGRASSSIQGGSGATSVLTLGSGNTSSTFGGALEGNLALIKTGTGTLTLTGAVTITGIITVKEGTLDLSAATLSPGTRINTSKLAVVKLPTTAISKLYVDNVKLAPGRWGAPGSVAASLADFESPAFSGAGVVTVANTGMSSQERWKTMKHGFFVHYVWDGYGGPLNADGTRPASINETADRFDATGFANDMEAMGVEYVIFTAWQANFFPLFNSSAMDKYHSGRTSNRDMIGDMITAVRTKGIRVLLYTHPYQPIKYLGTYPNQYADLEWNDNLINDVHAELVDRYGDQIDGLFLDENFGDGTQDQYVDYARLLDTIRHRNPELVLMQNWGSWESSSIYTADMMHREKVPEMQYRWPDLVNNPYYSDTTPGPSTQLVARDWSASIAKVPTPATTTAYRSAEGIFRTAVLGAGSCTLGGGWIWGAGPYAGNGYWPENSQTFVGRWEPGVLEAMQGAAAYMAPIAASIKNTYPSTSWLTAPYTPIANLPQGFVATRSTDDTKEYIHVLNPPGTKTLNLPLPADGKVFTNARLMKNNRAVTITRNTRGMSLTLGSQDNWETLNTVIVMDVASPGARSLINNNDPSVTYTGTWTYGSGRATTEYGQDAHETSTNGNSLEFTFHGTDIGLIGTCASNRGTADVFIDNVFQESINLYSATTIYRRTVFSKSGLNRGAHTLKVVKTGGTLLTIDAFKVTELIDSDDPSLTYSGTWSSKPSANAIGGEIRETSTNGDTMILNFEGNGIDVIGSKGVGGGNVRYKLNSSFELSVPQSSNFTQAQALVYTSINSQTLSHGLHTLTGWKRRGAWADVDAFRIYKGSSTPSLRWGAGGGGGTGTWNIGSTANWYDGSAATSWQDFGGTDYSAIFSGTAGTVTLASKINVNRLTFQTAGYTVTANALNFTGPPAIINTPAGITTINSLMAGTASLVKAGPGTLRISSAANTNNGNTTINEGILSLTGTAKLYSNLGWGSRTVSINNGATLEADRWDGATCSLGQLDYSFANLIINGGTIRYTGNSNGTPGEGKGFTIGAAGATLQSDAPAGQTWNIHLDTRFSPAGYGISSNSGGSLNLTGTGNGLIQKAIPGSGGLAKSGAGTWTLTNTNTYTGSTTVSAGKLIVSGVVANTSAVTIASGAELSLAGTLATTGNLSNHGTLVISGAAQLSAAGVITNNGTLIITAPGFTLPGNLVNNGTILYLPAAPSGLTATAGDSQVSLGWSAVSGASGYVVKQSVFSNGPFTTIATTANTSHIATGLTGGTTYHFVVSATNAAGEGPASATASATPQSLLPAPRLTTDIGTVGLAGSAAFGSGTYTLKGAGAGITGTADACRFVHQMGSGDCSVTVRVQSLSTTGSGTKVGVMIRESLAANARTAGVWVSPGNGILFTRRTTTGGTTAVTASTGKTAPYWVRLTRTGSTFQAFLSTNGSTWTQFGSNRTISMGSTTYIGIATTSGTTATLCTGVMTNESVTP